MVRILTVVVLAFLFLSSNLMASSCNGNAKYMGHFYFSKIAFNKEVKSVTVHAGISVIYSARPAAWSNVQDIKMVATENGFKAKGTFVAGYGVNAKGESSVINGLGVEYWVDFVDGTHMITNTQYYTDKFDLNGDPEYYYVLDNAAYVFENMDVDETVVYGYIYGYHC